MARPSGLNQSVTKQLLDALSIDGDFAHACEIAGVPLRTGYHWRKLGEDPDQPLFVAFRDAVNAHTALGARAKLARDIAALKAETPASPSRTNAAAIAVSTSKGSPAA